MTEADAKVYLPLVDAANEAGLDYVVVHARHAGQKSREPPRWDAIGEVKARASPSLMVIGNGDVCSARDALEMRRQTGCDGVMIARAAIRNPWLFRDFAPGSPAPASSDNWDGGRSWPSGAEVEAATAEYRASALSRGGKPKFAAFHEANFARLASGDRSLAVASPRTIHLS